MARNGKATWERTIGIVREGVGRLFGNTTLELKGRFQRTKGNARELASKAKHTLSH